MTNFIRTTWQSSFLRTTATTNIQLKKEMIVIYKVIDAETKEELFVGMDELAEATYVYP